MKQITYSIILITTVVLILSNDLSAQGLTASSISVDATGEVYVPADRIHFRVTITQFKSDPREAFQIHKEQEQYLTEFLVDLGIEDSLITANPISISQVRRYNNSEQSGYETQQQVMIVMDDISQFESMQLELIENGFTNFSGSFSAENLDDASDRALQEAVKAARYKANLIAQAAGKEVIDVVSINYSANRPFTSRNSSMEMVAYDASSSSLLQFERTIPVSERVTVQFQIN